MCSYFYVMVLDIEDICKNDKLFYFLDCLKLFAKEELHDRNVYELADAIAGWNVSDFSIEMTKEKKLLIGKGPYKIFEIE